MQDAARYMKVTAAAYIIILIHNSQASDTRPKRKKQITRRL